MASQQSASDPKAVFVRNFRRRFYRGLDYLALFIYVAIVSIGALLADYAIVRAIELTVASDVSRYPIVSRVFEWFKIGSAFLVLIAAAAHAFFSAWSQMKFEIEVARESIGESTRDG
jgi:hypothetical protein